MYLHCNTTLWKASACGVRQGIVAVSPVLPNDRPTDTGGNLSTVVLRVAVGHFRDSGENRNYCLFPPCYNNHDDATAMTTIA